VLSAVQARTLDPSHCLFRIFLQALISHNPSTARDFALVDIGDAGTDNKTFCIKG
jgi:hypothetical protein